MRPETRHSGIRLATTALHPLPPSRAAKLKVVFGPKVKARPRRRNDRFGRSAPRTRQSATVKSFGRRQAYESPRGRNPRATVGGYGDFDLRLKSAMARPQSGSGAMDADRSLRCESARLCRPGTRLAATLSAAMITTDACGSVAGDGAPAAEVLTMPCRVMKPSPGSSPAHPAARAAASIVQTPR